MSKLFLVEIVARQRRWIALHELDISRLREDPDSALLVADAAVALRCLLDLRQSDLVDECCTVAVAAVGLEGCLLFSHFRECVSVKIDGVCKGRSGSRCDIGIHRRAQVDTKVRYEGCIWNRVRISTGSTSLYI